MHAIYIANRRLFVPCSSTPPAHRKGESVALVSLLLLESFYSLSPPASLLQSWADFQPIRSKKWQKQGKSKHLFARFCLTLVILETTRGKILIYFCKGGVGGAGFAGSLACPLVAGGRALWGFRTCQRLLWSSGRVFPPFCPLCRSSLGALSANMGLFRVLRAFLAWFGVFVWVCVVWVLCVACGVFVRVWS